MATIVIKTVKPSGGDYTSLAAWEAGEQRDLVTLNEIAVAECYSMSDTATVIVNGWITDATHYIRIYTPASERHDGKWNTVKYRLEPTSQYTSVLDVREPYTEIDGLQIRRAHTGSGDTKMTILLSGASNSTVSHNILTSGGVNSYGIYATSSSNSKFYNNLIYDVGGYGINGYGNLFIYNNTVINCTVGIGHWSGDSSKTWTLKNNLVSGSTIMDFENLSGTFTVTYCASGDATADDWGGVGNRINQTFVFVDSVNKDFHLASGDVGALGWGTDLSADPNLSFTTDIDGETRAGTWDIGADEYVAAGGGSIPVSGSTAGLGAVTGKSGLTYGATGSVTGFSVMRALAGLSYAVTGSVAAVSLPSANGAVQRDVSGAVNGLSVFSGAISTSAQALFAGSINALSLFNGKAGLTSFIGGVIAGGSSLFASAGVLRATQGTINGVSFLTAGITGLPANYISGQVGVLSTLVGGLAMGYGLSGSSLSALLLMGDIHEVYSSSGLVSGTSFMTAYPVFSGQLSSNTMRGSPRFDVTRYGGGAFPTVHADSAAATVTQYNNNPKVTR